ncbi:MAG: hypothetical protein HN976_34345, partial [Lentisphaerae bacterium]|nr:hypothetical protein [Lentisphaerota bacterium]
ITLTSVDTADGTVDVFNYANGITATLVDNADTDKDVRLETVSSGDIAIDQILVNSAADVVVGVAGKADLAGMSLANLTLTSVSETEDVTVTGAIVASGVVSVTIEGTGGLVGAGGSIDANTLQLYLAGGTVSGDGAGGAFKIEGVPRVEIGAPDGAVLSGVDGLWSVTSGDDDTKFFPLGDGNILGLVLHNGSLKLAPADVMSEFARESSFLSTVRQMKSRNGVFDPTYFIHSFMSLRDVFAVSVIDFLNFGEVTISYNRDDWPPALEIEGWQRDRNEAYRRR